MRAIAVEEEYLQENPSCPLPAAKIMDEAEIFYPGFTVSRIGACKCIIFVLRRDIPY